jgi:hypothetical protein
MEITLSFLSIFLFDKVAGLIYSCLLRIFMMLLKEFLIAGHRRSVFSVAKLTYLGFRPIWYPTHRHRMVLGFCCWCEGRFRKAIG